MTYAKRRPSRSSRRPKPSFKDARSAALAVLLSLDGKTTLDHVLDRMASRIAPLDRRDRALLNQLVYGVLRWRLRLDAVIGAFADRPLKKLSPVVLEALRLGLLQILFLDRIPPSAAVNTSVDLVRAGGAAKAAGFVNAMLRSVLREPKRFALPDAEKFPVDRLAQEFSFPRWLVKRWIGRFGPEKTAGLCRAMNEIPPVTVRCNFMRNNPEELAGALAPQLDDIRPHDHLPGGFDLYGLHCPIHEMQAFADGRFAVQDGAAQLVSLLLNPRPGDTVLDACAGVGGKSLHLAELMENRGRVVAMDNIASKLSRLEVEARRLGLDIIDTRQADLDQQASLSTMPLFDRVLLDAPCTGLGVLRRNPDAKWSTKNEDIARCAERQARFIDFLGKRVKPGGTLVFSVCSMEPEENEAVIKGFLKKHPNFGINDHQTMEEKSVLPFLDQDGFLRTDPLSHQMDGFFAARLTRRV